MAIIHIIDLEEQKINSNKFSQVKSYKKEHLEIIDLTEKELEEISGGLPPIVAGVGLTLVFGVATVIATSVYESISRGYFFFGFNSKIGDGITKFGNGIF